MILCITTKRHTGLTYHRQLTPFDNLDIPVVYRTEEDELTDDFLKGFKCVSFLREIKLDVQRLKSLGLKIHFDIDDYWVLPSHHQLCKLYKLTKHAEKTIQAIKDADFVTTTTTILAERIKPYNANVYVLPNAINPREEQWIPNRVEPSHDRLRFGYVAGSHHQKDVEMIHPELVRLYSDATVRGKWQLLTAGYNFNAMPDGSVKHNPYYRYIEQLFTCRFQNGKAVSLLRDELTFLLEREKLCEFRDMDDPYQRLNGIMDVKKYGVLYDSIDVSLVPLIDTAFNHNKSQLKMIEAGFKRVPVMVSDVLPYRLDFTKDNVLVTKDNEWKKNIKYLVENPNKVVDLREKLFEYVSERYDIDIVNKERKQIFEQWLK